MPKYIFFCKVCDKRQHKYVAASVFSVKCPECGGDTERELPQLKGSSEVTEMVDTYAGVAWNQNHKEIVKKRHDDYYWQVEVPRLVEKYSLATCLEQGWLVYDDKGQLVINKPPSKR